MVESVQSKKGHQVLAAAASALAAVRVITRLCSNCRPCADMHSLITVCNCKGMKKAQLYGSLVRTRNHQRATKTSGEYNALCQLLLHQDKKDSPQQGLISMATCHLLLLL